MRKADELVVEDQRKHDQDILKYVREHLPNLKDPTIEAEILRKSAHVFLWVELVVKMLNEASGNGRVREREIRQILCDVPDDLNDLYCELLTKGRKPKELRETVYMFQWVLFAKENLSPEELYFAVLSGTDPDNLGPWDQGGEPIYTIQLYVTSVSKGLVELTTNADPNFQREPKVQFIHESVRDFLLSAKGLQLLDSSLNQRQIGKSHNRLTSCCYSYIMMTSLESLERETAKQGDEVKNGLQKSYPFLRYAMVFILNHMEDAEMRGSSQLNLLLELQPGSKGMRHLQCVAHILTPHYGFSNDGSEVMHEAAAMGLYEIFRGSLEEIKVNVNIIGGRYGTALQAAAARGHEKIVQLCLDHGADVKITRGRHYTALHAAVRWNLEPIARILLEHGADVNARGSWLGTALHIAREKNYISCIDLLLEYGAEDHPPIEDLSGREIDSAKSVSAESKSG